MKSVTNWDLSTSQDNLLCFCREAIVIFWSNLGDRELMVGPWACLMVCLIEGSVIDLIHDGQCIPLLINTSLSANLAIHVFGG